MDAEKEYGPFNHDLINAVAWLKGNKIIIKDKDVVTRTGYTKGTVSSYINGNKEASPDFRQKFEEVFKLDLVEFQTNKPISKPSNDGTSEHNRYVTLLEKTNDRQEADLLSLRKAVDGISEVKEEVKEIKITVNELKERAASVDTTIDALREWLVDQFVEMKKGSPHEVATSMHRKRVELEKKANKAGIQKH